MEGKYQAILYGIVLIGLLALMVSWALRFKQINKYVHRRLRITT